MKDVRCKQCGKEHPKLFTKQGKFCDVVCQHEYRRAHPEEYK